MPKETWYERTLNKIKLSKLSEGDIRALRRKLREAINKGVNVDEVCGVYEALSTHKPRVSGAQAQKGLKWLHARVFRADGKVRDTRDTTQFTSADLNKLRTCIGFQFVGLWEDWDRDYLSGLYPIYRCVSPTHGWFDYVSGSWQSGRQLEIINRGT